MRLLVGGARASGPGYPNAEHTLRILKDTGRFEIEDCSMRLPDSLHLWTLARARPLAKLLGVLRILLLNLTSVVKIVIGVRRNAAPVYAPYPAVFFLWMLSWIPRQIRPYTIADSYISIWDSAFRDRSLEAQTSVQSRLVRRLEGRALRAADMVLVDTEANRIQLHEDFSLDLRRLYSVPLAIDQQSFLAIPELTRCVDRRIRVLFVGTMIPLHGIELVVTAIHALRDNASIEFRLIGDGQQAALVEAFFEGEGAENASWLRGWQDLATIADEIRQADICLGVFGGNGKAARVLPFKLYMYLAAGRPVISQSQLSLPEGLPYPPIKAVGVDGADSLIAAILQLARNQEQRFALAAQSRLYYQEWLSATSLLGFWNEAVGTLAGSSRDDAVG